MKKITKLSLVAAVATLGLTNACADTLSDAFAKSKVKGEIRAQYFNEKETDGKDSSIYLSGGSLNLVTGSFNNFYAGLTFQTSHVFDYDYTKDNAKNDEYGSGSRLGESYLAYKIDNSHLKIGRQFIKTPLVAGSGSRMIKDSFEAFTFTNKDLPQTTLTASKITKYARRVVNGGISEFEASSNNADSKNPLGENGAITVMIENNSIKNLKLTAQHLKMDQEDITKNDLKVTYFEGGYKLGSTKLSAQHIISNNGAAAGATDGSLTGVKIDHKIDALKLTLGYNKSGDEADFKNGLGESAHKAYTKLTVGSGKNAYKADTKSYMAKISYKIADATLGLGRAEYDQKGSDEKTETELTLAYKFNKNTSLKASHSSFNNDGTNDKETRLNLSYKF